MVQKARVFVAVSRFHPSLLLAGKASRLQPSLCSAIRSSTRVGSSIASKRYAMVEVIESDQRTSLLGYGIIYGLSVAFSSNISG